MNVTKMLRALSEAPGASGYETVVADVVRAQWGPLVDEIVVDRVGNVVATKRGRGDGERRRLLLAAHMDEIALMVTKVEAQDGFGFLRVSPIGGVDIRHVYGQLVQVHPSGEAASPLTGVVASLPPSMLPAEKRTKGIDFPDLIVDLGLPAERVQGLVRVGDVVTFRQPLRKLQGDRLTGKAFDNRVSVGVVTVCLDALQGRAHAWDIVAVATVQEETSLLGAYTASHAQRPDAAIALDVAFAASPAGGGPPLFDLGGGPTLGLGVNVHPGVYDRLEAAAKRLEITIHTEPHGRASGTDAMGVQLAREGIPTGLLGVPVRYMHTMVEISTRKDIERAGRLLAEFAAELDGQFLTDLEKALWPENDE